MRVVSSAELVAHTDGAAVREEREQVTAGLKLYPNGKAARN